MTYLSANFAWFFIAAIIGIVGCADALKATSLIFGRIPNANKTTATTSTTTSTTTVATIEADPLTDDAVSKTHAVLHYTNNENKYLLKQKCDWCAERVHLLWLVISVFFAPSFSLALLSANNEQIICTLICTPIEAAIFESRPIAVYTLANN